MDDRRRNVAMAPWTGLLAILGLSFQGAIPQSDHSDERMKPREGTEFVPLIEGNIP